VVFSGDLTFNGAQRSHEDLRDKLARIVDAGIPIYVLPGNHDLQNVWAARFEGNSYEKVDSISPSQFSSLYAPFGFEQALARDTDTLSYTVEIAEGLRLLMLDGNVPGKEGVLTQSALNFARAQLKAAEKDGAQIISVTHQPLISHNSLFAASFSMRGTDELLELFQNYSVTCNLCGHMHIQHIATAENGLTEIAGSALSVSPDQFGLLHLQDRSAQYETSVVNVNQWAKKNAIKDENLLDFATYSATFFRDTALWQASNELSNLSEDQADRLANYYADMNAAYFAGRMDQFEWDDTLYEAWQKTGAFEALYMQSIADEARVDHTKAEFTL
jgi:3',5'-cyclic AMP phosphodiesterase CpdA